MFKNYLPVGLGANRTRTSAAVVSSLAAFESRGLSGGCASGIQQLPVSRCRNWELVDKGLAIRMAERSAGRISNIFIWWKRFLKTCTTSANSFEIYCAFF